jgi:hypothetical protein
MTQSILIVGNPKDIDIVYYPIDTADRFLKDIAHQLFTEKQLKSCWYIEGWIIHDLFSEAQTQLFDNQRIESTIVGQLLIKLFLSCQEIVLWYFDDFNDFPEFTDIELAMNEISSQLTELSGEIHLIFRSKISIDKRNYRTG